MTKGFIVLGMVISGVWITSIVASCIGWWWRNNARRLVPALVAAVVGLILAYAGLTRLYLNYKHEVNGRTTLRIDSRWFFPIPLVISGLVLWSIVLGANRRRKGLQGSQSVQPPPNAR